MDLQLVFDELFSVVRDLIAFIPRLINGLLILLVGIGLAIVVRWLIRVVLRRLGFDTLMDEVGLTPVLHSVGIRTPVSRIIAQIVFVLLVLSFLVTAARLMGLEAVAVVVQRLLDILTVQRIALAVSSLASVALVVLVPARFIGVLQTGGAALCAAAVVVGGLGFGLNGAFAGLALAEVAQASVYLSIYLRRAPRS